MSIFLSNFFRRVGDWIGQNRARVIKWLVILAACLVVAGLIYHGVERWHKWRYEKAVQALEKQFQDADARAKAAEARANLIAEKIEAKEAEIRTLEAYAEKADAALLNARRNVAPLKVIYETIRTAPDLPACVSYADACKELSAAGFACK